MTVHKGQTMDAIAQHIKRIVEGIEAKDLDGLRQLYSDDVVSFDVEPPLRHAGIEAKLANWAKAFAFFQDVRYEVRDLAVTADENVAFAHGFGRLHGTLKNGVPVAGMWVRATFCFRRIGGHWLVTHDQVSVPFDVAAGAAVTGLEP
ncbi:nuclear transport factor 2 family protein [Lentzea sp. BCCO 10_0061]|uniref:Nuclear transport factor 2 family protein n=1 Tax=Lentzea sokolovensis TaxID=3095429 RepID=A0ABU4UQX3_9PSEU|nr:nuclear transport factor 2 family protein [Lentzea sp. BCCO 10_0061]MDX8141869.1 nuclear transport factor 2 family protein [Lentzea sp. BCCO 10_0061]